MEKTVQVDPKVVAESISLLFTQVEKLMNEIFDWEKSLAACRAETAAARKNLLAADHTGDRTLREKSFDLIASSLGNEKNIIARHDIFMPRILNLQSQYTVLRKVEFPVLEKQVEQLRLIYEDSQKTTGGIRGKLLTLLTRLSECEKEITQLKKEPAKLGGQAADSASSGQSESES